MHAAGDLKLNRRHFLSRAGLLSLAGSLIPSRFIAGAFGGNPAGNVLATEDVFTKLKVRPVINAMGTVTVLGGSIMPPEVMAAMEEGSKHFVVMPELLEKAG